MKKILLVIISLCLLLTGCEKLNRKNLANDLDNKIKDGYKLEGDLSVSNNDVTIGSSFIFFLLYFSIL